MTERQELGSLEAMLFAHAEPVETARLADALRLDADEVTTLLQKLQKRYDEQESGMVILYFEPDRWQMTTRPYYGEMVKRILDTRRNAPLSPAALEVLAVIAYNQPVSRSFIEQVRGVDSSSTVTKLLDKGLINEADYSALETEYAAKFPPLFRYEKPCFSSALLITQTGEGSGFAATNAEDSRQAPQACIQRSARRFDGRKEGRLCNEPNHS